MSDYLENRYEIIEEVAEGGEGRIFKAYDHAVDRFVALKELELHKKPREEAFKEARAIARITHPNVVQLFDIIEEDGSLFLVMEYVDGTTLRDILDQHGALPFQSALGIFIQLASAVEFAHNHGILHLDIKPENILVTPSGKVKLADFGVSRFTAEEEFTDKIMGSTHYLAPEALKGRYTIKSDVFSLGTVLYEMLTGENPFFSYDPEESFKKIVNYNPPPVTSLRSDIPEDFSRVVSRALEKVAVRRYEDVTRFRIKVERYCEYDNPEEPVAELFQQKEKKPVVYRRINLQKLIAGKFQIAGSILAFIILCGYLAQGSISTTIVGVALITGLFSIFTPALGAFLAFGYASYLLATWSIGFAVITAAFGIASFIMFRDFSPAGARGMLAPALSPFGLEFALAALLGVTVHLKDAIATIISSTFAFTTAYFLFTFSSSPLSFIPAISYPFVSGEGVISFVIEAGIFAAVLVLGYILKKIGLKSTVIAAPVTVLVALAAVVFLNLLPANLSQYQGKLAVSLLMLLVYSAGAEILRAYRKS